MIDRVTFNAQSFPEPALKLGIIRLDVTCHDTDGGSAVDLLQPIQDRSQVLFVLRRIAHVVNAEHNHGLDTFLTDPLRSDELRKIRMRIPWIAFVEIRKAVAVFGGVGCFVVRLYTEIAEPAARENNGQTQHRHGHRKVSEAITGTQVGSRQIRIIDVWR